jgi:hypothetical protein
MLDNSKLSFRLQSNCVLYEVPSVQAVLRTNNQTCHLLDGPYYLRASI